MRGEVGLGQSKDTRGTEKDRFSGLVKGKANQVDSTDGLMQKSASDSGVVEGRSQIWSDFIISRGTLRSALA